jgi:release factor glutamine methyltransferase
MLPLHANLQQTRSSLEIELRKHYPEGEAASVTRLILEHVGYPASRLLMEPNSRPGAAILSQIKEIVAEINTGRPIQYILGYTHFLDLKISLNDHVLIPRPETEEMVYLIRESHKIDPGRILDLGSGSGCIALALKKCYPGSYIAGVESCKGALEVAVQNSQFHGLYVDWIEADMLQGFSSVLPGQLDLIVSNPPYVRESERCQMHSNVLDFEPHEALFVSDDDPLIFYGAITSIAKEALAFNGAIWVEINENLGKETAGIFESAGFRHVTVIKDINGKERFIRAAR